MKRERLTGYGQGRYGMPNGSGSIAVFDKGSHADQVYTKLGIVEDVEENLGLTKIDLGTLLSLKTVFCKETFRYNDTGECFEDIVERKIVGINIQDNTLLVGNSYEYGTHSLGAYGKTWALTKEELE